MSSSESHDEPRPAPVTWEDLTRATETPSVVRRFSRIVLWCMAASPFVLAFVPWQQTVQGRGTVIAYSPVERSQVLTARIPGQVRKWHVVEGSHVKKGEPVVDLEDNDPDLGTRLTAQLEFLRGRLAAAKEEVVELRAAATATEAARESAVNAAKANLESARKAVEVADHVLSNAKFSRDFEQTRFDMIDKLHSGGTLGAIESKLSREEARLRIDRAGIDRERSAAELERSKAAYLTQQAQVLQTDAAGISSIAVARSNLRKGEQSLFGTERELQDIENRIERFKARHVVAPCDGVVFRVHANVGGGGQYLKEGDELCTIIPDTNDRVVELTLTGRDAPLVLAYAHRKGTLPQARLQFEGWPAILFSGFPDVSIGTFGGKIRQIDYASDASGNFRVLIEPEQHVRGDEWPDKKFLRQGNQVIGWVFLNRVPLGFEIWRRLNGFPPVLPPTSKEKDQKSGTPGGKEEAPKAPKVKVG
jgi:multidrug efflux pump subunit AcrA (membrane-fusion protein)